MDLQLTNIIPITKARSRLSNLVSMAISDKYFILTKGGNPSVALVDIDYLRNLEKTVKSLFQKTFINPSLEKYTRNFSDNEIKEWQKEDRL